MPNFYEHKNIYEELGIDMDLICIMQGYQPVHFLDIEEEDLYYSPTMQYAQGQVAHKMHITLSYGLLPGVKKEHVDQVLNGWTPEAFVVDHLEVFPSYNPEEQYSCIVAKPTKEVYANALEAHSQLSMLPNIQSFPEYKPHGTLVYVKKESTEKVYNLLVETAVGMTLAPTVLDYGDIDAQKVQTDS